MFQQRLGTVKRLLFIVGFLLILSAIFLNWHSNNIYINPIKDRTLFVLLGFICLAIAVWGYDLSFIYPKIATFFLNTILLVLLLETSTSFAIRLASRFTQFGDAPEEEYLKLPYYQQQTWSTEYWLEDQPKLNTRYEPYLIWQPTPFKSNNINISQAGIRETPNSNCSSPTFTLFAFGGSTMWGYGAPDWGTIPAYLHSLFSTDMSKAVCIKNFGSPAYVTTQNLIALEKELRVGNVPDLVIFYDGINDVYAAYQSGQVGVHHNLDEVARRFEADSGFLESIIVSSTLIQVARRLIPSPAVTYQSKGVEAHELSESIVKFYLADYELVNALATQYGFDFAFFVQPVLAVEGKPLTDDEQSILLEMDDDLIILYRQTYNKLQTETQQIPNVFVISSALDQYEEQIWVDWTHITPKGNEIIANTIYEALDIYDNE